MIKLLCNEEFASSRLLTRGLLVEDGVGNRENVGTPNSLKHHTFIRAPARSSVRSGRVPRNPKSKAHNRQSVAQKLNSDPGQFVRGGGLKPSDHDRNE